MGQSGSIATTVLENRFIAYSLCPHPLLFFFFSAHHHLVQTNLNRMGANQSSPPQEAKPAPPKVEPPKKEKSKYVVTVTEKDGKETHYTMYVKSQTKEATIKEIVQFHKKTRRLKPEYEGQDFSKVTEKNKEKLLAAVFASVECKVERYTPKHGDLATIQLDAKKDGEDIIFAAADRDKQKSETYAFIQKQILKAGEEKEKERREKVNAAVKQSEIDVKTFLLEQEREVEKAGATEQELKSWRENVTEKTKKRSRPTGKEEEQQQQKKKKTTGDDGTADTKKQKE